MGIREFSWALFALAIGLWCAGLFQPALKQPEAGGLFHYTGLNCLLLGWIGVFGRPLWLLPWSANVLFWISLLGGVLRRQPGRVALIVSLAAVPLALVTLFNRTIETDEAGHRVDVVAGPGFYLWMASMLMLAAAQLVRSEGRP